MKLAALTCLIGAAVLAQPREPLYEPDSQQRAQILESIRQYANNYTQNLPNFICTQVTQRQQDETSTGKHFKSVDRLQEQLTYFEHEATYKLLAVNGVMVSNRDRLNMGGAMTQGEFGSMMREIFAPSAAAEFEWIKFGKIGGKIMNVFSYRIPQERSHYSIMYNNERRIFSGYHGTIEANKETNAIMRITLECDSIPGDYPVQDVSQDLWYGVVKIADREYVLPDRWDSHSRTQNRLDWNKAEFKAYRKYETGATITCEEEAPAKPPVKKP